MAQPTPYNRQYNFTDYQTTNPNDPLPAAQVDAELNAVKLTSDQTRTNLGIIQRDDGRLANQSVHKDAFDVTALALIGADGFEPKGAWAASTAYVAQDLVDYNDATYVCLVAHTSSPAFPTDLAANKWLLLANAAIGDVSSAVDYFEGNGSTTAFTLTYSYASATGVQVYVNGVLQLPTEGAVTGDYSVSGTTLTFVTAPPSPAVAGRKNVVVWGANVTVQANVQAAQTAASNAQGFANAASSSASAASTSATNAASSASAASTSATNAANSATAAATSASAASTSATNAANSATAASTSQSAAASSATAAAASQSAAATSATNAAASQSAAATSATNAANSATTATNQASTATTQATNASNSASAASTSATNAASSASAASTSATNAANSATAAGTSATNAANSATAAATSASNAATSETNAAASQASATASQTAAATSASNAATSHTNAANSATAAAGSATAAAASETAAASSAVSAASSAASAAAILDNFDDRYLGAKASDPALDNDGNALIVGALYFNTTDGVMKIYTASGWIAASSASVATLSTYEYVATGGQTVFTGADANGNSLSYTGNAIFVTLNGVRLRPGDDYTANDGTTLTLVSGATVGDELVIDAFGNFLIASVDGANIVDDTVNISKLNATGTRNGGTFLAGDNTFKTVAVTPTAVSDQSNSSTGYFALPSGTTAQRPGSPSAGYSRFNTDLGSIEFYDGTSWISTNLIPTVDSVTGTIYAGAASNLTIAVTNGTDTVTVRFSEGGSTIADVEDVTLTSGSATVAVPSAVYGQTAGDTIAVSVINSDGTPSSNAINKTVAGLPTGGTITTSGGYRYHTFTSSSDLVVPSGFSASADYLVVAGGGGGGGVGASYAGGGGGAGGHLSGSTTISANTYSITIGGGGNGGSGGAVRGASGTNSSFGAVATATGGGGGGAGYGGTVNGLSGGSGGGGSFSGGTGGSGTSGQGNRGGNANTANGTAGGGGGAGAAGGDIVGAEATNGGVGLNWLSLGTFRAGGGGGGNYVGSVASSGGNGGGGRGGYGTNTGGAGNGVPGTDNTGGGGGGGGSNNAATTSGGNGGSGIVIVRYAL